MEITRSTDSSILEEQRSAPVSSLRLQTEEDVSLTEQTASIAQDNEVEIDREAAAHSPLNEAIPLIPTELVQSLVLSFWDRAADLEQQESRETLVEMFLEMINTIANVILDALKNFVLEGREQGHPLLLSEEAVSKAVYTSVSDSFHSVLGGTHKSISSLSEVLIEELTASINSTLCRSQVQNKRLVVPKDSEYRPRKEQMKAMVIHARKMLRSIKNKVRQGCGGCVSTNHPSSAAEPQEEAPSTSTSLQSIKQEMGRSCSNSERHHDEELEVITAPENTEEEQRAPSFTRRSKPLPPEVMERSTEEKVEPRSRCKKLRETLGISCRGSVQEELSDGAESEEEQPRPRPRPSRLCPINWCGKPQKTSSDIFASKSLTSGSTSGRLVVLTKSSSPSIQAATAEVREILLDEAVELSGAEESSLSYESLRTASAIVTSITDELSNIESESGGSPILAEQDSYCFTRWSCLTGLAKKIKAFFTLCYAKTALRDLLQRVCQCSGARPGVTPEEVMELASPLLEELVHVEGDVYEALPQSISRGEFNDLSENLTDVITTSVAVVQNRPMFRKGVGVQVRVFLEQMSNWVHMQTQLPILTDPVQRALERIHRVGFRMYAPRKIAPRPRLTHNQPALLPPQPHKPAPLPPQPQQYGPALPPEPQQYGPALPPEPQQYGPALPPRSGSQDHRVTPEVPIYLQPSQSTPKHVVFSERAAESPAPTPDVPRTPTSKRPDPLSGLWSRKDCNKLVYEVVSKIFQAELDPLSLPLYRDVLAQLEDQVSEWKVYVNPSRYKDVASAVYKDLCKGQKETHVHGAALAQRGFSSTVLDAIHYNLVAPLKKRSRLGSFLHSLRKAFCRI